MNNPLEIYDWCYESCRHNTKDELLKRLAGASDIGVLSRLEQAELAKVLAERMADTIVRDARANRTGSGANRKVFVGK